MHITFVRKILAGGAPCAHCREVENRLRADGLWSRIDAVLEIADDDPEGDGAALARAHGIRSAPFFVVREAGEIRLYTRYAQFVAEVLS
jgi:hypothetical protein